MSRVSEMIEVRKSKDKPSYFETLTAAKEYASSHSEVIMICFHWNDEKITLLRDNRNNFVLMLRQHLFEKINALRQIIRSKSKH